MTSKFKVQGMKYKELRLIVETLAKSYGIENIDDSFITFKMPEDNSGRPYEDNKKRVVVVENAELMKAPGDVGLIILTTKPFED